MLHAKILCLALISVFAVSANAARIGQIIDEEKCNTILSPADTMASRALFNEFFSLCEGDTADFSKMLALIRKISERDTSSKYFQYTLAWAQLQLSNYDSAYETIEMLLLSYPDWPEIHFLYGQYLSEINDPAYVQEVQHCLELNPRLFQPLYFLASNLYESGNLKLSLVYYNKLEEVSPSHKSLYYNRATVRAELSDFQGAILDYSKALEQDPQHYRALFNRGHTYLKLEDYAHAEKDFDTFIMSISNYATAFYYRGAARYYLGRMSEACADMKIASEMGHESATSFLVHCK